MFKALRHRWQHEWESARRHFTACPACGQWTPRGICTWCGVETATGTVPAAAGPGGPAAISGLRRTAARRAAEHLTLLLSLLKWLALGSIIGILSGTASAAFLGALDWATSTRLRTPGLLLALPAAGVAIAWMYRRFGQGAERGNNLILEEIHQPGGAVPIQMAPLVLAGTVTSHLFGASVGREGTAVQMGGSLAALVARLFRLSPADRRILLMGGISGGFGSVFGTPLAGTVFGMEVLRVGAIRYEALVACLTAAFVGDRVTAARGIHHTPYAVGQVPAFAPAVFAKVLLAGCAFGLAALLFTELAHGFRALFQRLIPWPLLRPAAGGLAVIGLTFLLGTREYLGLGVPMIQASFARPVPGLAFLYKTAFTTLSLGAGFVGGEVTPLFFTGATLGNALGQLLGLPLDFMAALGFVAVFAGAANTPLSCILLGAELFGGAPLPYIGIATVVSYVFSGHRGIYGAQRVETPKSKSVPIPAGIVLSRWK